jgi:hypothetical protein
MFARQKPRQEDEPLVPHGLVWQATDIEPSAQSGPEQAPVKGLDTQSESSSPTGPKLLPRTAAVIPKKPSASSPPPFWHPRKAPEIVKPDSAASGSQPGLLPTKLVTQNATQFAHAEVQAPITQGITKCRSLSHPISLAASNALSATQKHFTDLAAGLRRHIGEFGQRISGAKLRIRPRLRIRGASSISTIRFREGLDFSSERLRGAVTRARRFGAYCEALGKACFTKAYAQLRSERFKPTLERLRPKLMRVNLVPGEFSETHRESGIIRPGLRVRLGGLPLRMRIFFTRTLSEWRLKSETATGDSRLWTSMTMGVCTALLALAIVSSARHYGNASLPSHVVHSNHPQTSPQTTSPNVVSSRPAGARTGSQAKTLEPRFNRPRPAAQTRSKPRRNEDDYVARDTYVYYGDSRPKSR